MITKTPTRTELMHRAAEILHPAYVETGELTRRQILDAAREVGLDLINDWHYRRIWGLVLRLDLAVLLAEIEAEIEAEQTAAPTQEHLTEAGLVTDEHEVYDWDAGRWVAVREIKRSYRHAGLLIRLVDGTGLALGPDYPVHARLAS